MEGERMSIVTLFLWFLAGFLIGILLYFVGGFAVYLVPDSVERKYEWVNGVANHYSAIAMKLIQRAVLLERGTKYAIFKTSRNPEKNADEFSIGGKQAGASNETGLLSTLHGKPFGLLPPPDENVACYVSPELAEFGAEEIERREQSTLRDNDGNYNESVNIGAERPLAKLRNNVRAMIPGNRSLFDIAETVDLYKQSQSGYATPQTKQYMILVIAYGATVLLWWLVLTQAGGAVPEGGVPVPPMGG